MLIAQDTFKIHLNAIELVKLELKKTVTYLKFGCSLEGKLWLFHGHVYATVKFKVII